MDKQMEKVGVENTIQEIERPMFQSKLMAGAIVFMMFAFLFMASTFALYFIPDFESFNDVSLPEWIAMILMFLCLVIVVCFVFSVLSRCRGDKSNQLVFSKIGVIGFIFAMIASMLFLVWLVFDAHPHPERFDARSGFIVALLSLCVGITIGLQMALLFRVCLRAKVRQS